MNIPQLSSAMSLSNIQSNVGVAMLSKNLDDAQSSERVSILKKAISDFIGVGSSFENIIFAGNGRGAP